MKKVAVLLFALFLIIIPSSNVFAQEIRVGLKQVFSGKDSNDPNLIMLRPGRLLSLEFGKNFVSDEEYKNGESAFPNVDWFFGLDLAEDFYMANTHLELGNKIIRAGFGILLGWDGREGLYVETYEGVTKWIPVYSTLMGFINLDLKGFYIGSRIGLASSGSTYPKINPNTGMDYKSGDGYLHYDINFGKSFKW